MKTAALPMTLAPQLLAKGPCAVKLMTTAGACLGGSDITPMDGAHPGLPKTGDFASLEFRLVAGEKLYGCLITSTADPGVCYILEYGV